MSSDLRFMLSESDVHDRVLIHLVQCGYKTIPTFGVMADDRPGMRAAIAANVLDPNTGGLTPAQAFQANLQVNLLLAAWIVANQRMTDEVKASAECKALRLPNMVSRSALIALRVRYENEHGRITDSVFPCAAMIESMLEELEEGSYTARALSEVISVEMAGDESVTITEVGVNVKVRKTPKAIALPCTTEELRTRFKTLSIAYTLASYRHSSRLWLRTATAACFLTYVEYLLSDQVSQFHLDQEGLSVKASWVTVLNYDLAMRKAVCRAILYDGKDFATAINEVVKDINVKERYFTTPTAIISSSVSSSRPSGKGSKNLPPIAGAGPASGKGAAMSNKKRKQLERQTWIDSLKAAKVAWKGAGKGKGKGAGKGGQARRTPDGRSICDFYNKPVGCVKDTCQFVHVCNKCYGEHSAASNSCAR